MSLAPKRPKAHPAPCRTRVFSAKTRLEEIAEAIQGGVSAESFREELDRLLGTEMEDRDRTAEAVWEQDYRKLDDE
jgi:hypothetical protein